MVALLALMCLFLAPTAYARNTLHKFPIQEAIAIGIEKGIIIDDVQLYFAGWKHPKVLRSMGEFRTNKKTNAFNKSDKAACEWAFFSAIKSLQERALKEGGDAVIKIKSNYKSKEFSSAKEFECGAGNIIAGVALKGTVVKIK